MQVRTWIKCRRIKCQWSREADFFCWLRNLCLVRMKVLNSFALEGKFRCWSIGCILELHSKIQWAYGLGYIWSSNNWLIHTGSQTNNPTQYILKKFQLCDEMLEFNLHEIQWKACCPVDFREVWHHKVNAKFTLAEMVQAAIRVTTVLCKHCIKLSVEHFMWIIMFLSVHDRLNFVILGSLRHRVQQRVWEGTDLLDKEFDSCDIRSGHFEHGKMNKVRVKPWTWKW